MYYHINISKLALLNEYAYFQAIQHKYFSSLGSVYFVCVITSVTVPSFALLLLPLCPVGDCGRPCVTVALSVCVYVCVAIDIDATGLDPEDNELPANHRSPKASPNTVMSPLAKEKRMPFFKKVTVWRQRLLCVRPAHGFPACGCPPSLIASLFVASVCCDGPLTCMPVLNLSLSPLPSRRS